MGDYRINYGAAIGMIVTTIALVSMVGNDFSGVGIVDNVALVPTVKIWWHSQNERKDRLFIITNNLKMVIMKNIELKNGLKILYYPMMNTHSITVGLYVKSGIAYETKRFIGITHMLEHLHFRGTGNMSQDDLYYEIESIGSGLSCITYPDFLRFTMKILPDKMKEALYIFKNIMVDTTWNLKEFQKEKEIVIEHIRDREKYVYIQDEIRKIIFKNTSLANKIMGTEECIQKIEKRDMELYKNNIFNVDNMILCITGCIEYDDIVQKLKELEEVEIKKGNEKTWMKVPKVFHCRRPEIVFQTTDDNVLDVNMSFDISGNAYLNDILYVINSILGEGTGSKLQGIIREKLGYTFEIYSYIEKYRDFAVLHIRFSVKKTLLESCLKEIICILQSMKYQIALKDLEVSIPFLLSDELFLEDDTEGMNMKIAWEKYILNYKDEKMNLGINANTVEQVQLISRKIFTPENCCLVVIGNTSGITKKSIRLILEQL